MPEAPTPKTTPPACGFAPGAHREALEFIEHVTANAGQVQRRVLAEILAQNAPAEYLRRHGVSGAADDAVEAFRRLVPLVTYEGLQPDILRIANGDTSPILSGKPISEFLTRYASHDRSCCAFRIWRTWNGNVCADVLAIDGVHQLWHVRRGEEADADHRRRAGQEVAVV